MEVLASANGSTSDEAAPQGEPAATTTPLDSPIHGAAQGRGIFLRRVTSIPVRVALS